VSIQAPWSAPPRQLAVSTNAVDVWRALLDQPEEIVESLAQLLSADEQARANRFHFEIHRRHFVVARACLRKLLARYVGVEPQAIRFTYTTYGKPELASTSERAAQVNFNLAHSGGLAVYAFTGIGEIGVDLEDIRPEFTGDEIARRFFSATEVACLDQLPVDERALAFFNCWTRKEAFIKAKGMGLSLALDQFDVTLAPDTEPALLSTKWDESEAGRWSLRALDPGVGYVGAIAVPAHDWQLNCWEFAVR
jgi:4'-phosphopantetheinyl transferase